MAVLIIFGFKSHPLDSIEAEDNLAWEIEVQRVNAKSLLNAIYVVPITYSCGVSIGVFLTMPERIWEFIPIYFFPVVSILFLRFINKAGQPSNFLKKFFLEISLFLCTSLGVVLADNRFVVFAGLVNLPIYISISMGTLRNRSEILFIILFGVISNVLIYSIWKHFDNYSNVIAAWLIVLPIAFMSFYLSSSRYDAQKKNFFMTLTLNRSNQVLAIKNKEIIDSITYAKHLQEAILPPENYWLNNLPQSFILYKPKDIVAGDFYWMEKINGRVFFAVADCTGHGVPGAIVSVVCGNALNRTVLEFKETDPGKILDKTRELVLATFEKSNKDVKDGMDISLCCLNTKTLELYWAGANNPLWYIRQNKLEEIKADKQPIGKYAQFKPYTTHCLQLEKDDHVFIFTDGYADQFGGSAINTVNGSIAQGKKFKYKQLKELLVTLSCETIAVQKQKLEVAFENWKGNLEQVDDVCIIGIRL